MIARCGSILLWRASWLTALVIWMAGAFAASGAEPPNLVLNGDFSQTKGGQPVGWKASGDENVDQRLTITSDQGNPCAKLACTRLNKQGGASHAMIAQSGEVNLERGKMYEFSCRARAENLSGRSVSVALQETQGWQNCGLTTDLKLGSSWRTFRRVFTATRSVGKTGRLQFWYTEPGTFYLDDVKIVEVARQDVEFTDVVPSGKGKNLVPNGSFELGGAGWSSLGRGAGWGNLSFLHGHIETAGGTQGRAFLRVPLGGDQTPVLYFDYLRPVVKPETQPLAASLGWIPVEKGAAYTISCDMRASVEGVGGLLGVRAKDPAAGRGYGDQQQKVTLSKDWKRYSFTFQASRRYVFVTVGPSLNEETRVDVDLDAVQLEKGEKATAFEPRSPVEVAVAPSEPGGVFVEGAPAALRLMASNNTPSPEKVRIEFRCSDYLDKPVPLAPASFEVAGNSAAGQEVPIPREWKGFYRVLAACSAKGETTTHALRLAVVPPPPAGDSVAGINHAFVTADLIHQSRKAGVTWYRDWSLKWQDLEPSPGQFRWEVGDNQINRVLKENVNLMALLPPFPSANWISEAPADLSTKGYPGERIREAWAPKEPDKLGEFVGRVVARYKDRMKIWEFLNEPIYTDYALPGERQSGKYKGKLYSVADYVRLLKVVSAAMHQSDPQCKVMGGLGSPPNLLNRDVIEAGCLDHVDIFNLHMYPGARLPEAYLPEMDALLTAMDKRGGRKPIWITEFSYYGTDSLPRRPFFAMPNSWSEERLLPSERECGDLTIRYYTIMMARGVEKVFIHSGSSGSVNEPNYECCLMEYGGAPRKVFAALAVLCNILGPKPTFAAEKRLGESGYCFGFETGKQAVVVLWTADEDVRFVVPMPPKATECLDLMGSKISSRPIQLSPSPVYVIGTAGTANEMVELLAAPAK